MGRPPKPKRFHELAGDHHKGRFPDDDAPAVIRAHPAQIGPPLGEVGRAVWEHFEPMLYNNGTLSASDALTFSMLCERCDRWMSALQRCDEDGEYLTDRNGRQYQAPWFKAEKQLFDQVRAMAMQFGLSPLSRSGVKAIKEGKAGLRRIT